MDRMTPGDLGVIAVLVAIVVTAITLHDRQDQWLPFAVRLWRRYWPERTAAAGAAAPAPAPAPRTDGAPRADAVQGGADGARTADAPASGVALTPQIVEHIRLIARHKLQAPADGKTATAKALGIARGGGSERYALFSAAWEILYPTPANPAAPPPVEYISDRDRRIDAELAAEAAAAAAA